MSKVYMMVTITNRNKRKDFRTFFKEHGLPVFLETTGEGRHRVKYWIIRPGRAEKLLFLAIVTGETWKKTAQGTDHEDDDRCTRDGGIIHCSA